MSCVKIHNTKGVALSATALEVLPFNLNRKGLVVSVTGGPAEVAVGNTPAALDYITIVEGHPLVFDGIVPVGKIWAKGTGTLVYGESV